MEGKTNYFNELSSVNVSDKTEKKNGLTYLSWSYAWGEVKKRFPEARYRVYENKEGWNYFTDGKTCWVKTSVTIDELEHVDYLPVMDYRNASIPIEKVTSFDVNKAIQRSITKACARHGLGLYIYAGEDLPDGEEPDDKKSDTKEKPNAKEKAAETKPNKPFKAPTAEQLGELKNYNVKIAQVLTYLKKQEKDLTFEDVEKILIKKRRAAQKAEELAVERTAEGKENEYGEA